MQNRLFIIFISIILFSCNNQERKYLGGDYRLFKNKPVWGLAQKMRNNDLEGFKKELSRGVYNLNYQEKVYGNTLLMMTIYNEQFNMFQILLEARADPNIKDDFEGASTIHIAIKKEYLSNFSSLQYVKILLENGANVNDTLIGKVEDWNKGNYCTTVLVSAVSFTEDNLKLVQFLVEKGANINSSKCGKHSDPLSYAIGSGNMKCAYYLLTKGAFFEDSTYLSRPRDTIYCKEDNFRVLERLREHLFELGSEEHIHKMKIVAFLKEKGFDYSKEPISERTLNDIYLQHQNDWDTYKEKY